MVVAIACPVNTTSPAMGVIRSSPATRFSGLDSSDLMGRSTSVSPTLSTSTEESENTITNHTGSTESVNVDSVEQQQMCLRRIKDSLAHTRHSKSCSTIHLLQIRKSERQSNQTFLHRVFGPDSDTTSYNIQYRAHWTKIIQPQKKMFYISSTTNKKRGGKK